MLILIVLDLSSSFEFRVTNLTSFLWLIACLICSLSFLGISYRVHNMYCKRVASTNKCLRSISFSKYLNVSQSIHGITFLCWLLPLCAFTVYFLSIPCQGETFYRTFSSIFHETQKRSWESRTKVKIKGTWIFFNAVQHWNIVFLFLLSWLVFHLSLSTSSYVIIVFVFCFLCVFFVEDVLSKVWSTTEGRSGILFWELSWSFRNAFYPSFLHSLLLRRMNYGNKKGTVMHKMKCKKKDKEKKLHLFHFFCEVLGETLTHLSLILCYNITYVFSLL